MSDALKSLMAQVLKFSHVEEQMLRRGFVLKRTDDLNRWAQMPDPYQLHWYFSDGRVTINLHRLDTIGLWLTWSSETDKWRKTLKTYCDIAPESPLASFIATASGYALDDTGHLPENFVWAIVDDLSLSLLRPLAA